MIDMRCREYCRSGPPGLIPLLILRLAYEEPIHGYQVIEKVREMTSGVYAPETGVVYTALRRMEEKGLLTSTWVERPGGDRRVYKITEEGIRVLRTGLKALSARRKIVEELFNFYERTWGDIDG